MSKTTCLDMVLINGYPAPLLDDMCPICGFRLLPMGFNEKTRGICPKCNPVCSKCGGTGVDRRIWVDYDDCGNVKVIRNRNFICSECKGLGL